MLGPIIRTFSNEGSQCMFLWKNNENYPQTIPVAPS